PQVAASMPPPSTRYPAGNKTLFSMVRPYSNLGIWERMSPPASFPPTPVNRRLHTMAFSLNPARRNRSRKVLPARMARPALERLEDRTAPAVLLHVSANTGSDSLGNGSTNAPFQSIQHAVNVAGQGFGTK